MRKSKDTKGRLERLRSLYEEARLANEDSLASMEKHLAQYLGSREIDGSTEQSLTVRNVTYEIIESEISPDIPVPKADSACYGEQNERNARNIERLCSSVRDRLPFESMNDRDERYTYIYGGSVFYVEWDEDASGGEGGVRVFCLSPTDFIPQPGIYEVDDMEYCFLRFTTTKGELMRKYGVKAEELALAECEYSYEGGYEDSDTVTVITAFYKDAEGKCSRLVFSGELVLSDTPNYYARRVEICSRCGAAAGECDCGAYTVSLEIESEYIYPSTLPCNKEKLIDGDSFISQQDLGTGADFKTSHTNTGSDFEAESPIRIPYYIPRCFPIIIRRNACDMPELFGGSDCEKIRNEQQAINKIESRIMQKLLRAAVTPVMPEDASVALSNAVFGQVIKMKPGESLDCYGKIDTTPDISQDIAEADRLYDHAKRVLGITDALQGQDNTKVESGYARQLKISRAASRLESKKRLKYLAYSELYKLIFRHYLAFADGPRRLSWRDELGRVHQSEFNRYDFIRPDGRGGYRYDDDYLFSVDLNGGDEYQREAIWERNLQNLTSGTLGNPESPVTLLRYWQSQERAHYPYARENVEFFKELVMAEKQKISESEKKENEK